ncbi:hypothetical protein WJX74_001239 [Apatococcus lobatus]|uniref:Armadillo-like repeats domain-containing protein n=1 Tax=Apatococcus lobatus TaxID=904363 RepID=A0AAW1QC73_9CHLO
MLQAPQLLKSLPTTTRPSLALHVAKVPQPGAQQPGTRQLAAAAAASRGQQSQARDGPAERGTSPDEQQALRQTQLQQQRNATSALDESNLVSQGDAVEDLLPSSSNQEPPHPAEYASRPESPQQAASPSASGSAHQQQQEKAGQLQRLQQGVTEPVQNFVQHNSWARPALRGSAVLLGLWTLRALFVGTRKFLSPKAKKQRNMSKNLVLNETLAEYLPGDRQKLDKGVIGGLRMRTGFSPVEIFRKYMWYLLRERKFDQEAVADMVHLRNALGLKDEQVAEAIKERGDRIFAKFGNVMLETKGMTKAGIDRKATARTLFSKLLFLAEMEELLPQDSEAAQSIRLHHIFGATEDDMSKLRIVSLYEVDLDKLEGQFGGDDSFGTAAEDA